jgi:hypothetical protein
VREAFRWQLVHKRIAEEPGANRSPMRGRWWLGGPGSVVLALVICLKGAKPRGRRWPPLHSKNGPAVTGPGQMKTKFRHW